jgi:hypothetical protein
MNAEEAHKAATNIRHYFVDIRLSLLTYKFATAWWLQLSFFDSRSRDQHANKHCDIMIAYQRFALAARVALYDMFGGAMIKIYFNCPPLFLPINR